MNRDPFYQQVVERLQGKLDPALFEACAADLLRSAYPMLVPVRGGDDAGMDGAIADAQGEPFPLVTTTRKVVIRNLTDNLKSYLNRGGTRRKVVLATSQYLTQRRRENLFARASELGFTLINIHDQDAMAHLLYRSPEWCRELLNLAGDPSPLSAVPRTTRPQLTNSLIGREEALEWLRSSTGDRLLVGQPASGKTSLLRALVNDGQALFVISRDRGELAAAIRRQGDEITLIVDDAHLYYDVIPDLIQIRTETGAKFSILASCWPGFRFKIAEALNLNERGVHALDLLTRDEMVAVVKSAGLQGPNGLVREIVNQAYGRPGLAVTLALLCLQGDVPKLISGDALHRTLLSILEDLNLRKRARLVLASLSVGGNAGMPISDVAEFLGYGRGDVLEIITHLDESGFVYEYSQDNVSVQPPALRHVLVRDVFFTGARSLPIHELLARAPSIAEAAMTLLGVKARGGSIPEQSLLDVLCLADSDRAWREYAWMGREEASWVFANCPDKREAVVQPLLEHIPEAVIPELLQEAVGDERLLNAHPEHPLRRIGDWIKAARPNSGQTLFRRQMLLKALRGWLQAGKDVDIGLRALQYTVFPGFEFSSTDPGSGSVGTLHFGSLPITELLALTDLWEEVLAIIKDAKIEQWEPIQWLVENWVYPARATVGASVPEEAYKQMRRHASRMLKDIIDIAHHRPGIMHWARRIAKHLALEIDIPLDEDFRILYPDREREDWQAAGRRQAANVRQLAAQLCRESPEGVVKRIAFIETEAEQTNVQYPRWTPYLCAQIAEQAESAIPWLQALMKVNVTSDLVESFLSRAAQLGEPEWENFAHTCLDRQNYKLTAINLTLRRQNPPQDLFKRVLEQQLPDYSQTVETLCLRNEVPEATLKHLLRHESPVVASAAAAGEWHAEPQGEVRESVHEDWQSAVINHVTEGHWLKQVFHGNPILAFKWLEKQLAKLDFILLRQEDSVKAAIDSLDVEARKQLLNLVSPDHAAAELVAYLVDDNLEVYTSLLSSDTFKSLHLTPLLGYPEGTWDQKALLALEAGYTPEEVAGAVHGMVYTWWGNESAMWGEWIEKFEALCSHEDARIRAVGAVGRDRAKSRQNDALQRERNEAVFGRW